jgi:hypothetical protein
MSSLRPLHIFSPIKVAISPNGRSPDPGAASVERLAPSASVGYGRLAACGRLHLDVPTIREMHVGRGRSRMPIVAGPCHDRCPTGSDESAPHGADLRNFLAGQLRTIAQGARTSPNRAFAVEY